MDDQPLVLPAHAKINLFLNITEKRADGYHNLQTWFQFVDLKDYLTFATTKEEQTLKLDSNVGICDQKDNLIFKAFMAMQPLAKKKEGIAIRLNKRIPMGAGLGGGSSNAATTLVALNQLWHCGLSLQELMKIGVRLGADVPIFLFQQAAWAESIGEKLTPKPYIEQYGLIIKPNFHTSSAELFADSRLKRNSPLLEKSQILSIENLRNVFLAVVKKKYPRLETIFEDLPDKSKLRLTGSGSCFYLLSSDYNRLLQNQRKLKKSVDSWIVKTLNFAPIKAL